MRRLALDLGERLGKPVRLSGSEAPDALLSSGQLGHLLFGYPRVPIGRLLDWVAAWVRDIGVFFDKPAKFQVRSGTF